MPFKIQLTGPEVWEAGNFTSADACFDYPPETQVACAAQFLNITDPPRCVGSGWKRLGATAQPSGGGACERRRRCNPRASPCAAAVAAATVPSLQVLGGAAVRGVKLSSDAGICLVQRRAARGCHSTQAVALAPPRRPPGYAALVPPLLYTAIYLVPCSAAAAHFSHTSVLPEALHFLQTAFVQWCRFTPPLSCLDALSPNPCLHLLLPNPLLKAPPQLYRGP